MDQVWMLERLRQTRTALQHQMRLLDSVIAHLEAGGSIPTVPIDPFAHTPLAGRMTQEATVAAGIAWCFAAASIGSAGVWHAVDAQTGLLCGAPPPDGWARGPMFSMPFSLPMGETLCAGCRATELARKPPSKDVPTL